MTHDTRPSFAPLESRASAPEGLDPTRPRRRSPRTAAAAIALATVLAPALAACSSASPQASPWLTMGDTPEDQSDALLATVLDPGLPGCSAAVARDGDVVWADAVGAADVATGDPMTTDTRFDWASNSKHVTGMAVLVLVDDGAVSLDSPVAAYLPDAGPWAETTTVEELLHHTSGLPDYIAILEDQGAAIADAVTQDEALATLADVEAPAALPQPWAYSNSNYLVLASIVEAVSGESFSEFVEQRLFGPEGSSLAVDPLAAYPDLARRYHARTANETPLVVGWDVVGDGAVVGTPTAMAEWFDVMRTGLPGDPGIGDAMVAGAVDVPDAPGIAYGAGLFVAPDGFAWHTGGWEGMVSYLAISADRSTTLAVVCNVDSADQEMPTVILGLSELWFGPVE